MRSAKPRESMRTHKGERRRGVRSCLLHVHPMSTRTIHGRRRFCHNSCIDRTLSVRLLLPWGSRGRWFESSRPESISHLTTRTYATLWRGSLVLVCLTRHPNATLSPPASKRRMAVDDWPRRIGSVCGLASGPVQSLLSGAAADWSPASRPSGHLPTTASI
jgi:hypothetical protein